MGEIADAAGAGGRVGLRPVTAADREFLIRVYASTRADELALVPWSAEQIQAFVLQQFSAQQQEYERRFPGATYDVILVEDEPAGRLWVARSPEEILLLDIALLPEFQDQGFGAALIRDLIAEAAREGKRLHHTVFKFNPAALRFYERMGFTPIEDLGAYIHMEHRTAPAAAAVRPTECDD